MPSHEYPPNTPLIFLPFFNIRVIIFCVLIRFENKYVIAARANFIHFFPHRRACLLRMNSTRSEIRAANETKFAKVRLFSILIGYNNYVQVQG